MAGQAFQVTDALKDKKQQQDFSYSSALKTPIFTKRDRAQLILIFSAVIKVKGKPSLSYIPLVTPSDQILIVKRYNYPLLQSKNQPLFQKQSY
ncbi:MULTISPECIES: hypothetical protein [Fischerella]|uniref:hypothetical protein n=1 Tax=Fischerella TaxID=1190 RepID=UPI0002E3D572|nr:hypothetical protein [Fischerella muscicola]